MWVTIEDLHPQSRKNDDNFEREENKNKVFCEACSVLTIFLAQGLLTDIMHVVKYPGFIKR